MANNGLFHLKFEKWSKSKHSKPSVIEGYGGWIKKKTSLLIIGAIKCSKL